VPPLPMARHQLWVCNTITTNGGSPLTANMHTIPDEDEDDSDNGLPDYGAG
jgi:hypothetical protein